MQYTLELNSLAPSVDVWRERCPKRSTRKSTYKIDFDIEDMYYAYI